MHYDIPLTLSTGLICFSVNTFYRINQEEVETHHGPEHTKQVKEFKIGSVGLSDSLGILLASLIAVPTEVELCKAQVNRGKMLCSTL